MNVKTKEIYSEVYQILNLLGNEYINKPKTNSETFYLSRYCNVTQQNQPAVKNVNKLLSIVNEERHKVITILGLKIKFRRQG